MIAERPEQWGSCLSRNKHRRRYLPFAGINIQVLSTSATSLTSNTTDIGWGGFTDDFSDQPCPTSELSYVKFETRWGPYQVGWSATDDIHESMLDHDYYARIMLCPTEWCTVLSWFP